MMAEFRVRGAHFIWKEPFLRLYRPKQSQQVRIQGFHGYRRRARVRGFRLREVRSVTGFRQICQDDAVFVEE